MQHPIPCVVMRGGNSRGPYLLANGLPRDLAASGVKVDDQIASMDFTQAIMDTRLDGGTMLAGIVSPCATSRRWPCLAPWR